MTFVEYVQALLDHDLLEWQKTYLNKVWEIAEARKTAFIFPTRRGCGTTTTETITTMLLIDYMLNVAP